MGNARQEKEVSAHMDGVTIRDIHAMTALYFGIPLAAMRSPSRKKEVARPRMVAMAMARTMTPFSLPHIAKRFKRDHTTILSGCKRAAEWTQQECRERDALRSLPALITAFHAIQERHVDWWLRQGPCSLVSEKPAKAKAIRWTLRYVR